VEGPNSSEGGGGLLSCVGDHILRKFYTLYVSRFRTYEKTKEERGPQNDKQLPQSPFASYFFALSSTSFILLQFSRFITGVVKISGAPRSVNIFVNFRINLRVLNKLEGPPELVQRFRL
jgi:hypothetical protein